MEPQTPTSPNQAPQPSRPEVEPVVQSGNNSPETLAPQPAVAEVDTSGGEQANQNSGIALPQVQQTPTAPTPPVANNTTTTLPTVVIPDTPDIAEDVDLIETEWVNKAKKIVDETKDDPRQQKRQVSALKADYMKKRYGKDMKLSDD